MQLNFLFRELLSLCSYSFWRWSKYFSNSFFDPGGIIIFHDIQFSAVRFVMSTFFNKKGTFNHCGRSKASNSTHHGRYVFPSLRSAASLSIFLFLSVCLCVSVCVSVFFVVFGASAMKVNAWTCALATASDLESAWRTISSRTRRMVNCA